MTDTGRTLSGDGVEKRGRPAGSIETPDELGSCFRTASPRGSGSGIVGESTPEKARRGSLLSGKKPMSGLPDGWLRSPPSIIDIRAGKSHAAAPLKLADSLAGATSSPFRYASRSLALWGVGEICGSNVGLDGGRGSGRVYRAGFAFLVGGEPIDESGVICVASSEIGEQLGPRMSGGRLEMRTQFFLRWPFFCAPLGLSTETGLMGDGDDLGFACTSEEVLPGAGVESRGCLRV